jgi:hypothetical protein
LRYGPRPPDSRGALAFGGYIVRGLRAIKRM